MRSASNRRPELVIFDCDGVLVDSEAASGAALQGTLRAWGEEISVDELDRRYRGMRMEEVAADFLKRRNQPYDPRLAKEAREATWVGVSRGIEAIPGAPQLVQIVEDAGLACCVASSGSVTKMRITLSQIGLFDRLEGRLYSAVDVERGKPAPDVFLYAAREMGFDPSQAVVIEDSAAGARGAKAAGMRVIGYTGGRAEDEAALKAEGAETVASMSEVPALLGLAVP